MKLKRQIMEYMNKVKTGELFIILIICFIQNTTILGQKIGNLSDSLTLNEIMKVVIGEHPSIKQAEESLNEADAKIGLAKVNYFPNIDITGSYAYLWPVSQLSFPGLGTFKFYPANNYNFSLNYNQTIWDFGRTARNVSLENSSKELTRETLEQVKQKMAILVISNFYSMVYLQEAIKIKNEQILTLAEHLDFIKKKITTGSAIEYEILSIQVKISAVESQRLDIEGALSVQVSLLNSLLGLSDTTSHIVKNELTMLAPEISQDSIFAYAIVNRDEMLIAQKKAAMAELKYKIVQSERYPVFNGMAIGGWKNGFFPDIYKMQDNYLLGLGLKIPILEGTHIKYNIAQAKSSIASNNYEIDITRRKIINEIIENQTNMKVAEKKVEHLLMQLSLAQKAYDLANINFKAGAITNLELLDASTNLSESHLNLLKSKIDYIVSIYKIKASMGERLY